MVDFDKFASFELIQTTWDYTSTNTTLVGQGDSFEQNLKIKHISIHKCVVDDLKNFYTDA